MRERVPFWLVVLIASVAGANSSAAVLPGLQASLVLEKQQYLVGEPIMLIFRVRNIGAQPVSLSDSDPYGECSPYQVAIDPSQEISPEPNPGPPCARLFQIEESHCLYGGLNLIPRQDVERRMLLNRRYRFTQPGTYMVKVRRHLSYFNNGSKQDQRTGEFSGTFKLTVAAASSPEDLNSVFAPYVADLHANSYERRREAAATIGTLPTPVLEPYLVQMLWMPDVQSDAIRGLRQLNSERSRRVLLDFVRQDDPLTFSHQLALEALGEMRDAAYGAALLTLSKNSKHKERQAKLLFTAARLDPTISMPIIQRLLESSREDERKEGINALGAIERSEVLPILVQKLTDPSSSVRQAAAGTLVSLTRKTPSKDGLFWSGADPATDAGYWAAWLRTNPASPIHPIRECPQIARQ